MIIIMVVVITLRWLNCVKFCKVSGGPVLLKSAKIIEACGTYIRQSTVEEITRELKKIGKPQFYFFD